MRESSGESSMREISGPLLMSFYVLNLVTLCLAVTMNVALFDQTQKLCAETSTSTGFYWFTGVTVTFSVLALGYTLYALFTRMGTRQKLEWVSVNY